MLNTVRRPYGKIQHFRLVNKVRSMVQNALKQERDTLNIIPGLDKVKNRQLHVGVRVFWFLAITGCLLTCLYQIGSRIAYFLEIPTTVDVGNDENRMGKMPSLVFCTRDTQQMEDFLETNAPANYTRKERYSDMESLLVLDDVDVGKLWSLMNSSYVITGANLLTGGTNSKNAKKHKNRPVTQQAVNEKTAVCTQIYYEDDVLLTDPSIEMQIKLKYPTLKKSFISFVSVLLAVQPQYKKMFDGTVILTIPAIIKTTLSSSIQEYLFLNHRRNPCANIEEYQACERECSDNVYAKYFPTCRFPFMFGRLNLPYCKTSKYTHRQFKDALQEYIRTNERIHCKCVRLCHQISYTTLSIADALERETLVISMQSGAVRTMAEKYAYETILLFCDIGGNLGLFIGLSCLSMTQIITSFTLQWVHNRNKERDNSKFGRKANAVIRLELKRRSQKMIMLENVRNRQYYLKKIMHLSIMLVVVISCVYLTYDRVAFYFKYPTMISVEVVSDEVVELPTVITCSLSRKLWDIKKEVAENKNITCENIDFLDLIDLHSSFTNNPDALWAASDDTSEYIRGHPHLLIGNITSFSNVEGNCAMASTGEMVYMGYKSILITYKIDTGKTCKCRCTAYFMPPKKQFSIKNYVDYPCESKSETKFVRQTIVKLDLPNKRCESVENVTKCEQDCYKKKLDMLGVSCRLPFMPSSNKQLCTTSASARETTNAYLKAHLHTHAAEECGCLNPCNETIYTPITSHLDFKVFSMGVYSLKGNIREIITHSLAYPLIKLYCSIGSNLGFFLGLSILSLIEIMQQSARTIYYAGFKTATKP